MSDAFFSALAGRSGASLAAEGAKRRAEPAAATGRQAAMAATGRQEALRVNDMARSERSSSFSSMGESVRGLRAFADDDGVEKTRCPMRANSAAAAVA